MEKSKKVSSNPPAVMQTHKRNEISEYVLEAFRSRLVEVPGERFQILKEWQSATAARVLANL